MWVPAPPGGDRPTLQRSQSAKKKKKDEEVLSTSLITSGQSATLYRHLRQHRNSWPTIEAAAKAIKRTYTHHVGGAVVQRVRHLGLRPVGRGFKSCSRQRCVTTLGKCLHLCVSVTKQYNLVPAKGR